MYISSYIIQGPFVLKLFFTMNIILISISLSSFLITKNKINIFKKKHTSFESLFWSGIVIEELYEKIKIEKMINNPTALLFSFAAEEWINTLKERKTEMQIPLKRISTSIEKGLAKVKNYIKKELLLFYFCYNAILILGFILLIYSMSSLFFEIGKEGQVDISFISKYFASCIFLSTISILSSCIFFVLYNYLNIETKNLINNLNEFSKDLYIIFSREMEYNYLGQNSQTYSNKNVEKVEEKDKKEKEDINISLEEDEDEI